LNKQKLFLQVVIVSILYIFFWESILFSPIRVFLVAIHESCHGLAALITGGNIISMELHGYEGSLISSGGFVPFIVSFGYIGSAIIGSILMSSKHRLISSFVFIVYVLFILIYYSTFSIEILGSIFISFTILFLIYKNYYKDFIVSLIGTFLAFQSIEDIKNYFLNIPYQTDAGILASYFNMQFLTLPIALIFLVISLFIWFIGLKKINYFR
jgi:hypothetical protein